MSRLPMPQSLSSVSDLSDGDFTLFWQGDGWEASLSFDSEGMHTCYSAVGAGEGYDGPFSALALQRFFGLINEVAQATHAAQVEDEGSREEQ